MAARIWPIVSSPAASAGSWYRPLAAPERSSPAMRVRSFVRRRAEPPGIDMCPTTAMPPRTSSGASARHVASSPMTEASTRPEAAVAFAPTTHKRTLRPLDRASTSPVRTPARTRRDSSRVSRLRARAPAFSAWLMRSRIMRYSPTSPREQDRSLAAESLRASSSLRRVASWTTAESAWNCAKEDSRTERVWARVERANRLTTML